MYRRLLVLGGIALFVNVGDASADCGDMVDVGPSDFYCNDVDWMKNRAVTLGCAASEYCPNEFVPRSQMAAFMRRLGTVLTPVVGRVEADVGTLTFLPGQQVSAPFCLTAVNMATAYPRAAYATATYSSGSAIALGLSYSLNIVYSNDGVTWTPVTNIAHPVQVGAGASGTNTSSTGLVAVNAQLPFQLGLTLNREDTTAGLSLGTSRCALMNVVQSRDGTSTPF